jgi:translation initiation factor 3 subunit C
VVRSQKDRTIEAIRAKVNRIKSCRKNNDWSAVQDEFEEVNKLVDKSKVVIMNVGMPKFYIKMLAETEDHVMLSSKDKESIKKMKQSSAHALNRMKLSIRKHNKKYETELADYRANPENYADTEEEESDDDSSDESSDEESSEESDDSDDDSSSDDEPKKPKAKQSKLGGDSDSDDSLFDDDDSDDDSSDDEAGQLKGRARWLKKAVDPSKTKEKKVKTDKPKVAKAAKSYDVDQGKKKIHFEFAEDLTEDDLDKKVAEVIASRGRKNTDAREMLQKLEMLSRASTKFGARKEIPILMHLISSMYDQHRSIDDYMDHQQWRTTYRSLMRIVQLLEANKEIVLAAIAAEDASDMLLANAVKLKKEGDADADAGEPQKEDKNTLKVVGTLDTFIARLEDEYTKSLQQINPHTTEYVARLSDEANLVSLAEEVVVYFKRVGNHTAASSLSLLQVEHLYYKHDTVGAAVARAHLFNSKFGKYSDLHPGCLGKIDVATLKTDTSCVHPASFQGNPSVTPPPYRASDKLEELCNYIFKHGDERVKTRALLCAVFHHALHDRYHRARDMFLMSHIQDNIDRVETKTQILYNRVLATLGLSAFRAGLIQKAHDALSAVCGGRVKELLAQGQARWHDRDPEQEKIERRRQMPYHMHINPELLECCHMICAMLLELPHLTSPSKSLYVISKPFRKYMNAYNRQVFTGPPENIREHVMASAKALMAGEWMQATEYIVGLECWNLIPGDGASKVKTMLREKIREEAVRVYLLTYGAHYETLSLSHICEMFTIDEVPARRIISRMIFNKEISAAWEHPADTLVLVHTENTTLQVLAQQVSDKIGQLVDSNERMLDPLVNAYNYKEDWGGRGDGRKQYYNDRDRDGDRRNGQRRFKSNKLQPVRNFNKDGRDNRDKRGPKRTGEKKSWGDGGGGGGGYRRQSSDGDKGGYRRQSSDGSKSTEGGGARRVGWGQAN